MAQKPAKEYLVVAVGNADYKALIGGGEYSDFMSADGSRDFSSSLVTPTDIPDYAIINSCKIKFDAKQDRSNTNLYKSYIRFTPYALSSYTISGYTYSSVQRAAIGQKYMERGTLDNNYKTYEIDITQYIPDATYVNKGVRLAQNMRFDGTTWGIVNTVFIKNIRLYVLYTIPEYTISVSAGTGGTVTGGGTFEQGQTVTIQATPNIGYRFVKWSDGNTNASRTVTVSGNATYTAYFEKLTYAITASAGAGGTVSGGGTFEHGATVTIKATPDIGYRFVKWDEDGNTSASRTVTVSGNATYTAVFEAIIYTIKYVDNSGTSTVSASFGQEISARAISDKNITITYNETSSRGNTETYKFPVRGWKDSNSIVAKDGKTYTIDVFDAPFYANKYSDLYNVFGYNKYGLINHYIDYGLSEGRQCKPNSSEPCGVYLQDRTINSLSTTHGQQIVLEAVYEDRVLVTIGDISKSGYIFKGWQSPEHTELLQPGTQVYFTGSATLTAVWEAVDTPPEFTSASLTYAGSQVSAGNKVPAGESCILSVGVT